MIKFLITCGKIDDVYFKEVSGYSLHYDLCIYKDPDLKCWMLTDYNTGCLVKPHIKKFADVKPLLEDQDFLKKIYTARSTERYKALLTIFKKGYNDYYHIKTKKEKQDLWN